MAIPPKQLNTDYPVIDTDPHFWRVLRYARPSDYAVAAGTAAAGPAVFWLWERNSPAILPKGAFAQSMRAAGAIGLTAGFLRFYLQSSLRFWGWTENQREIDMDMKEMVHKVKRKEPLYGESVLTPYMQGVAARNSRYSQIFFHVMPWFNLVNHNQHGVDTAKYFLAAEDELERERVLKEGR
ncbi:hypothetical protein Q9L58_007515 [Maublancomyces gigas]|uniref:Uncharacterized protein n=1 Tax=Discina gigas TaxID=1032678 RepID=A0ABR3GC98_9PEZI